MTEAKIARRPTSFLGRIQTSFTRSNSFKGSGRKASTATLNPTGVSTVVDCAEPRFDIVLIHDFREKSRTAWCKDSNHGNFWPENLLPRDYPHARVHTYGYDLEPFASRKPTEADIDEYARDLLDGLTTTNGVGAMPIILIAHSMGGFIAKKAFLIAQSEERYRKIVRNIFGVIFFGMPHHGIDDAKNMNYLLGSHHRKLEFTDFKKDFAFLHEINQSFSTVKGLAIVSFFELFKTKLSTTGGKQVIVPRSSAMSGVDGEYTVPLDATHHDMCKYEKADDPKYVALVKGIRLVLQSESKDMDYLKDRYSSLYPDCDLDRSARAIREVSNRTVPKTCEWLSRGDAYRSWAESPQSDTLWLLGPLGSGKTYLWATLHKSLSSKDECYPFTFANSTGRGVSYLLLTLATKMAEKHELVRRSLVRYLADTPLTEQLNPKLLWKSVFVRGVFEMQSKTPIYWLIDAADMCEGYETLISLLSELRPNANIKAFVTSRYIDSYSLFPRGDLKAEVTTVELQAEDTKEDLAAFIKAELDPLSIGTGLKAEIQEELEKNAHGNFLWVETTLRNIREFGFTESGLRTALSIVPTALAENYEDVFNKLELYQNDLARQIFVLMASAARPLKFAELQLLVEDTSGDHPVPDVDDMLRRKLSNLLRVNADLEVHWRHPTLGLLLETTADERMKVDKVVGHSLLAMSSLKALRKERTHHQIETVEDVAKELDALCQHVLVSYAAEFWPAHLKGATGSKDSKQILAVLSSFFQGDVRAWIALLSQTRKLDVISATVQAMGEFLDSECFYPHELEDPEVKANYDLVRAWERDLRQLQPDYIKHLVDLPLTIYSIIPQLCPISSAIHKSFVTPKSLFRVIGGIPLDWQDELDSVSQKSSCYSVKTPPSITSIWMHPKLQLASYGCDNGDVSFSDVSRYDEIANMQRYSHTEDADIVCQAWSASGKLLATADDCRNVTVVNVSFVVKDYAMAEVEVVKSGNAGDSILQILFIANDTAILIITASGYEIWSLEYGSKYTEVYNEDTPQDAFFIFDESSDEILSVGPSKVQVFRSPYYGKSCQQLELLRTIHVPRTESVANEAEKGVRVTFAELQHVDSMRVLAAEISHMYNISPPMLKVFTLLPPSSWHEGGFVKAITSCKRVMGTHDERVVFLDTDNWVSSCDFTGKEGVKRHFFIPTHWLDSINRPVLTVTLKGDVVLGANGEIVLFRNGMRLDF